MGYASLIAGSAPDHVPDHVLDYYHVLVFRYLVLDYIHLFVFFALILF